MPKESKSDLSMEIRPLYNLHPGWENGRMSVVMGLKSRKEKKAEINGVWLQIQQLLVCRQYISFGVC